MNRKIAFIGNPALRKIAKEVTSNEIIQKLHQDLKDTLIQKNYGVAIAAPQIFEDYRLFFVNIKPRNNNQEEKIEGLSVVVNPEILHYSSTKIKMFEACLSINDLFGEVERPESIKIKYFDLEGKEHIEEYSGFVARVIQHEFDHLNGILFTDIADPKSFMSDKEYRKMMQKTKNN